ncbi:MAG: hypothetical protein C0497_06325 [Gemmatimonas sp.]|nr:hypothetical protein [Gemmatimonas sp.]
MGQRASNRRRDRYFQHPAPHRAPAPAPHCAPAPAPHPAPRPAVNRRRRLPSAPRPRDCRTRHQGR